jgi:predicted AAA+ superfamily ATPase
MFNRTVRLLDNNSFFLFGPRGTGKTLYLNSYFQPGVAHRVDLLDLDLQQRYELTPRAFSDELRNLPAEIKWVFVDEIQKAPQLLDVVHQEIERGRFLFALTGSSPRKLKRGGANLLAGRAFINHLFPLTHRELGNAFSLETALRWGTLPKVISLDEVEARKEYLRGYAHTYLQEEIIQEQVIRKLPPFRRFLSVAAQMNGQPINYSKLGRDIGAGVVSVQSYYQILEDTLLGFRLDPFHESLRKRQSGRSKFYFFDIGVQRALFNLLNVDLAPGTFAYGQAFEHFIVNEMVRLSSYGRRDYQFSIFATPDAEIDLVIDRPGLKRAWVEIKSTNRVTPEDVRTLNRIGPMAGESELYCLSRDPLPQKIGATQCLPWEQGLVELGL